MNTADNHQPPAAPAGLWDKVQRAIDYCVDGVWSDRRPMWWVRAVRVLNLSVRSFLDRDLQMRACALTFSTVLALVPALAMLFAIARGFGFQHLLQGQLLHSLPAQRQVLESALTYVDNYLAQTSQGAFVGVGLVVLLWTLYSLLSNVEDTFNYVWGLTTSRSVKRKFTDYTALLLLIPVLMVCSAGISIYMSDAVRDVFGSASLSPVARVLLGLMPLVITWMIFVAAYYMVPNTHVEFRGALWAGVLCGTLFQGLQWLFVTGQVYVSKYNAIYGSFAFLPLLLVWLQLSWLIALSGVVLTYARQNVRNFAHRHRAADVSHTYATHLAVALLAEAAQRFARREPPLTQSEVVDTLDIPGPLAAELLDQLCRAGMLVPVQEDTQTAYQPAFDLSTLTAGEAINRLSDLGQTHFIAKADERFAAVLTRLDQLRNDRQQAADIPITELMSE